MAGLSERCAACLRSDSAVPWLPPSVFSACFCPVSAWTVENRNFWVRERGEAGKPVLVGCTRKVVGSYLTKLCVVARVKNLPAV